VVTADYTLYHGDCLEIIPTLGLANVVLISDPPYGIGVKTNYKSRKRGALAECNDFEPIIGDDKPFDPTPLLVFPVVVLFGANYYHDKLSGGSWHVWDKLDGLKSKRELGFNDNSDCEFIWSSEPGASRIYHHRWMGAMKGSENGQRRIHPTQKPVALMVQIINRHTVPGQIVIDPYMGSGSTGVACAETGRKFIGIEKNLDYFRMAKNRIEGAYLQPSLLDGFIE
jgi:site-specific DNA-methyltransferase (adenine-specific)/modification methylase